MSAPPSGYNPEETVIQGGNAPITPMAGGGSIAPPGYNAEETVIQGGNAPITPMAGGADAAADAAEGVAPTAAAAQIALDQAIKNLTPDQQKQVEELMKTAFEEYMFVSGLNDIEAGRKTEEEAGLDAARASITAGTLFVNSLLKQRASLPKEISYYPEEEVIKKSFDTVPQGPFDATRPPILEFYRVQESNEGLPGFDSLIRFISANYQSKDWKSSFLEKLNAYEKRRLAQFWDTTVLVSNSNTNSSKRNVKRAPQIPRANPQDPKRMPLMDRATLKLGETIHNVVAIPAIQGDAIRFLNMLYTLEKLNILAIVKAEGQNRPKVLVKKSIALVFMPPFFAPAIDIKDEDRRRVNITLYSLYLEIEQHNINNIFMIPDTHERGYTMARVLNEYRNQPKGPLVNFLDPTYIYATREGTPKGILLSGTPEGKEAIELTIKDAKNMSIPPVFKPSSGGSLGGFIVVRTSNGPNLAESYQMVKPSKSAKAGDCAGLLWGTETIEQVPKPIHLIDTAIGERDSQTTVPILLVARLRYTGDSPAPICSASTGRLVQIPKPPDIFYGTSHANTKGVATKTLVLTEEDEYIPQADANPVFQIRVPSNSNEVLEDWYSGIYTNDEANFLNGMGLKPDILKEIFRNPTDFYTNWRVEVAQFLNGLVVSDCYSDTEMSGLLLKRECQQNRSFLDRVRTEYIKKGITAETLQMNYNRHMKTEFDRYFNEVKASAKATAGAEFEKAGLTLNEVTGSQYLAKKKLMGSLYVDYVYEKGGSAPTSVGTYFMAVARGKPPTYYEMRAPINDYSGNPRIFYENLETLKEKNPGYTLIY